MFLDHAMPLSYLSKQHPNSSSMAKDVETTTRDSWVGVMKEGSKAQAYLNNKSSFLNSVILFSHLSNYLKQIIFFI